MRCISARHFPVAEVPKRVVIIYFTSMNTKPLARFRLTTRLHVELGWTDLVRHATTRNPDVIGYLLSNWDVLPRCDDPYTLFEGWRPLGNLCVYIIRQTDGNPHAEWVITDGVFNQILPADGVTKRPGGGDEPHFTGLLGDVLAAARTAWHEVQPGTPFPMLPGPSGLPEAAILHRYEQNEAFIADFGATMTLLSSKEALYE